MRRFSRASWVLILALLAAGLPFGNSASAADEPTGRVTDGLVALYEFGAGEGSTVFDVSGNGEPLDLTISDESAVSWNAGGSLDVNASTTIVSGGPATKINDAVSASDEITVEAWVAPENPTQSGPARIASISKSTGKRNVTIGQGPSSGAEGDNYSARLRTTSTGSNGTLDAITTDAGTATTELTHLVYTRDSAGSAVMYIDGIAVETETVGGNLSNWDEDFRLVLANELTGTRPWLGELALVAFYDKALSATEVTQNQAVGAGLVLSIAPIADVTLVEGDSLDIELTAADALSTTFVFDVAIDPPVSNTLTNPDGDETATLSLSPELGDAGVHLVTVDVTTDTDAVAQTSFTLTVLGDGDRVTDGLLALYTFDDAAGANVADVSDVGTPLNLTIADTDAVTWGEGTLAVNASTTVSSPGAASKINDAVSDSGEITIEAWITADNLDQDGPARIVSISESTRRRNATLGQGLFGNRPTDVYDGRFRTTNTGSNGSRPSTSTAPGSASTNLSHVVYTRDAEGIARIYVNGALAVEQEIDGATSNWDASHPLTLANEATGDRPWLGTFDLVAIYGAALTSDEVGQNYGAGPGSDVEPQLRAIDDVFTGGENDLVVDDVLANDDNPNGGSLELVSITNDEVTTDPGIAFNTVSDAGRTGTTIVAASGALNFAFDPVSGFEDLAVGETDTIRFTYVVTNGPETSEADITLTIEGANDAPVAEDEEDAVSADSQVTIDVLANDTDIDTGAVLSIGIVGTPTDGLAGIVDGQIVYIPGPAAADLLLDETLVDTFTYTVTDENDATDEGEVTITVTGAVDLNEPPIAVQDAVDLDEDSDGVAFDPIANDTDPNGDPLTFAGFAVTLVQGQILDDGNGGFIYVPPAALQTLGVDETFVETIRYNVTDGTFIEEGLVVFTVEGANDGPVANDDETTTDQDTPVLLDFLGNDTDIDGDELRVAIVDGSEIDGAVVPEPGLPDGPVVYRYEPGPLALTYTDGESFQEVIPYSITDDNGGSASATMVVTVLGINDPPNAIDDEYTVGEDDSINVDPTLNDVDIEFDLLTLTDIDTSEFAGTATIEEDGSLSYTPPAEAQDLAAGESFQETLPYTVSDGNLSDTGVITFTTEGADENSAPSAIDDEAAGSEDEVTIILPLANDTDANPGDILTIESFDTSNVVLGQLTQGDAQTLIFTPSLNAQELDDLDVVQFEIPYVVSDGNGASDQGVITFDLLGINDDPEPQPDSFTIDSDAGTVSLEVTDNDFDAEDHDLFVSDVQAVEIDGSVSLGEVSDLEYTPGPLAESLAPGEELVDTFSYTVNDGNGGTATAQVTVTVVGVLPDDPGANLQIDGALNLTIGSPENFGCGAPGFIGIFGMQVFDADGNQIGLDTGVDDSIDFPAWLAQVSTDLMNHTPTINPGDAITFVWGGECDFPSSAQVVIVGSDIPQDIRDVTGQLLDAQASALGTDTPVVGATISFRNLDQEVTTDSNGFFTLEDVPIGIDVFEITGSTSTPATNGRSYTDFHKALEVVAGPGPQDFGVFYTTQLSVDITAASASDDVMVMAPALAAQVPGSMAQLEVLAGNAIDSESGTSFTGGLSISEVPICCTPRTMPQFVLDEAPLIVTIQPLGVEFDIPAMLSLPNTKGYAPGMVLDLWSLDPDLGVFVVVGQGEVSPDGLTIETISGGIVQTDWHFFVPNPPPSGAPRWTFATSTFITVPALVETQFDITSWFSDPNGDQLTYSVVGDEFGITVDSLSGVLTVPGLTDGTSAQIQLVASDGALSTTRTITFQASDRPIYIGPDFFNVDQTEDPITIDFGQFFIDPTGLGMSWDIQGGEVGIPPTAMIDANGVFTMDLDAYLNAGYVDFVVVATNASGSTFEYIIFDNFFELA